MRFNNEMNKFMQRQKVLRLRRYFFKSFLSCFVLFCIFFFFSHNFFDALILSHYLSGFPLLYLYCLSFSNRKKMKRTIDNGLLGKMKVGTCFSFSLFPFFSLRCNSAAPSAGFQQFSDFLLHLTALSLSLSLCLCLPPPHPPISLSSSSSYCTLQLFLSLPLYLSVSVSPPPPPPHFPLILLLLLHLTVLSLSPSPSLCLCLPLPPPPFPCHPPPPTAPLQLFLSLPLYLSVSVSPTPPPQFLSHPPAPTAPYSSFSLSLYITLSLSPHPPPPPFLSHPPAPTAPLQLPSPPLTAFPIHTHRFPHMDKPSLKALIAFFFRNHSEYF